MINNYDFVSDIYDIYNTADYDISFYLNKYKNFTGKSIELMAGTGRLSLPLIKSGINLDCVDLSKALLEKLSNKLIQENLKSNIYCQDIRFLNIENKYDLVIIAFNSFSEITNIEDQNLVFKSINKILNDSGEFIFTLYNPEYRRKFINNNISLVNEFNFNKEKILFYISSKENNNIVDIKQFYEFYDENGIFKNKKLFNLKFRLLTQLEIENLISKTGFKIKELYGNFDFSKYNEKESPFMIYTLQKS